MLLETLVPPKEICLKASELKRQPPKLVQRQSMAKLAIRHFLIFSNNRARACRFFFHPDDVENNRHNSLFRAKEFVPDSFFKKHRGLVMDFVFNLKKIISLSRRISKKRGMLTRYIR